LKRIKVKAEHRRLKFDSILVIYDMPDTRFLTEWLCVPIRIEPCNPASQFLKT
jgi:hypothetical protein